MQPFTKTGSLFLPTGFICNAASELAFHKSHNPKSRPVLPLPSPIPQPAPL